LHDSVAKEMAETQ